MKKPENKVTRREVLKTLGLGLALPIVLSKAELRAMADPEIEERTVVVPADRWDWRTEDMVVQEHSPFEFAIATDESGNALGIKLTRVDEGFAMGAFQREDLILSIDGLSMKSLDYEVLQRGFDSGAQKLLKDENVVVEFVRQGKRYKYTFTRQ